MFIIMGAIPPYEKNREGVVVRVPSCLDRDLAQYIMLQILSHHPRAIAPYTIMTMDSQRQTVGFGLLDYPQIETRECC
jgi:hypothetical protein